MPSASSRVLVRSPVPHATAKLWLTTQGELIDHIRRLTWQLAAGDFETLVIWRHVALDREWQGDQIGLPAPISLGRIAQATAIPRETVRRKLAKLAAHGHIRRCGTGWTVGSPGFGSGGD